jgi:hypothetical protein
MTEPGLRDIQNLHQPDPPGSRNPGSPAAFLSRDHKANGTEDTSGNQPVCQEPAMESPGTNRWTAILSSPLFFLVFTLACIIVSRDGAGLLHEWTHSTIAWLSGVFPNASPFDIHYGDWTLFNIDALEFPHLSETAFYAGLDATGRNLQAAAIAIAGPMMNVLLAAGCLVLITGHRLEKRMYAATFIFWFLVFNLGNIWCYVPLRTFRQTADIGFFSAATGISPWVIFIICTPLVAALVAYFFLLVIPRYWQLAGLNRTRAKAAVLGGSITIMMYFTIAPAQLWLWDFSDPRTIIAIPMIVYLGVMAVIAWRHHKTG